MGFPWLVLLAIAAAAAILVAIIALFGSGSTGTMPQQVQDEIRDTLSTLQSPNDSDFCSNLDGHKLRLQTYLNTLSSLTNAQKDTIRDTIEQIDKAKTAADC
ncbi:hypothetical protein C5F49_08885 [Nitrosopumilus oxyclinae]|uniref:Uncharacterized protein n=1 Tax=Nitrosopumilus oxyclinae TaxID=1959104 RepID=A0A7D5RF58_9ARCH|nr:hypothetical protein [Nitrosopumilus oxyclinae]QLH05425.1 hypothetical protein C5F49_08885 [Nitrosopumilus oxyclinae]